jgi:uncharacterized Tic20 family protein
MTDITITSISIIEERIKEKNKKMNTLLLFMLLSVALILAGDYLEDTVFMILGLISLFLSGTGILALFVSPFQ